MYVPLSFVQGMATKKVRGGGGDNWGDFHCSSILSKKLKYILIEQSP